jgi:hypothetical protein
MLAVKCHRQPVALERVGIVERAKIVALDDEGSVRICCLKTPGRIDRVDKRQPALRRRLEAT